MDLTSLTDDQVAWVADSLFETAGGVDGDTPLSQLVARFEAERYARTTGSEVVTREFWRSRGSGRVPRARAPAVHGRPRAEPGAARAAEPRGAQGPGAPGVGHALPLRPLERDVTSPACRDGLHGACRSDAYDEHDHRHECACTCHQ